MRQPPRSNIYRDAWCGELRADRCGTEVRVAGWVHRRRDHGGLIFIDLRDRSGLVQLVIHPQASGDAFALAEDLRPEHVVSAEGEIVKRAEQNVNPNLPTGEIEVHVRSLQRLAPSETPPFPIDEDVEVDENLRLKHRDARPAPPADAGDAAAARHASSARCARSLGERGFVDIETPILTSSTPEGARDFLVPSRLQPGSLYALPQSPQLFKQLLMMGGYERYYQIARCFRDEDLRADRQPEFTQLDVEMGFVEEDDVLDVTEAVMHAVFEATELPAAGAAVAAADLRRGDGALRLGPAGPPLRPRARRRLARPCAARSSACSRASWAAAARCAALNAGAREMSRSELDGLNDVVRRHGGKAVAYAFVRGRRRGARRSRSSSRAEQQSRPSPRRLGGLARATCCCSSPTSRAPPPRPSARCGSSSAGASG